MKTFIALAVAIALSTLPLFVVFDVIGWNAVILGLTIGGVTSVGYVFGYYEGVKDTEEKR